METEASRRFKDVAASKPPNQDIRLRLIQVAGGDPAFEAKLREMTWHVYSEADRPFGATEEGMFIWLEHQQQFMEP